MQFLEYLDIDLALEDYAAAGEVIPISKAVLSRSLQRRRWRTVCGVAAALACMVTVVVLGVLNLQPQGVEPSTSSFIHVEVLAVDGVQNVDHGPITAGARLDVQRLQIEQGKLTIRLDSGVVLELLGPTDVMFETAMRLRLTPPSRNRGQCCPRSSVRLESRDKVTRD
jgi:hypothetical protein